MNKSQMKDIAEFIVSFLIDRTGNELFDSLRERRKIDKILQKDSKKIEEVFKSTKGTDLYNLVEEFIMVSVFKEGAFYSPFELTIEQQDELWDKFKSFINKESGDQYVDVNYKNKIVRCVNFHNEKLNEIIMDDKTKIHIKMMNRQNETVNKMLNDIINTLNTNTKLQTEDDELNFVVEQLEAITKSYRYDINQLRKMQTYTMFGAFSILLSLGIFIPISLKGMENVYPTIIMAIFLGVVFILLLIFWKRISKKLDLLEERTEIIRASLWNIHFEYYQSKMENGLKKIRQM